MGDDTGVDGVVVDQGGPGQQGGNGAVAVPTMTEWGMIILAALLGIGSVYYFRRRGLAI
ncbi:MAG: IPTL-CTERM sorting domain-containing protein [Deltaproteobacteria bacterium]|nr:MAG: IPTL-CTERM sorting domain-containing protein [Deltaproteobacteria bacterium]